MEAVNKELILKEVPLFAGLSQEELLLIKERSGIREYNKGSIIYEEGSSADAFYCVIWGRVVIHTEDAQGNNTVLEYLHRGKYFGIISLLTSEPHSVTAEAINDSALLVIKRADFDFILKRIPRLAIDLSRTLSRRLKKKAVHQKTVFESTIISVFSSYSKAGKTVYAQNLAVSLNRETHKSVIILDIISEESLHSLPHRLGLGENYRVIELSALGPDASSFLEELIGRSNFGVDLLCISYKTEEESSRKMLLDILSRLVNDYHYIILDLPSSMSQFIFSVLNQSDSIHILTSPQDVDLKKTRNLIERLKADFRFQESKIKVIINEYKLSKITYQEQSGLLGFDIYATLPKIELGAPNLLVLDQPESEYSRAVKRISRQVGESLIGLALGVGVGYGFCHIGVLKVIEEENIPVDIIAGSSVGAVIACLWVTGRSAAEILKITKEEFKQPRYMWGLVDLTFPFLGFIKGNKLYRFLKKYLGNKTFYDLRLPLKIIASDVRKKEPRILDKGLLIDAVMASCAMPGVFRPFRFKGETLFDGGIINPLPTEILFRMGIRKIIAVNVTPSREDILRQYENIKGEIAATRQAIKKRRWFEVKQYFRDYFKTNILDIIFSSIEVMQSEIIEKEGELADIVLHPDTSGLHWLELYRAEEFAKRGETATRKNLDLIRQLINE